MREEELKSRFEALAPWHVNGTLEPAESRWIEEYARDHAEARAELQWYEALQNQIRANAPEVSEDLGWDKLAGRIRDEERGQAEMAQTPDVKKYAEDMLPRLEMHLQKAQRLQSKLFGGARK